MAYYAFLNENNEVVQVIPGNDEFLHGVDWEKKYAEIMGMKCKRTSYNTLHGVHSGGKEPLRKNYAGVGYTYDEQRDAFIPPRPYPSWTLNEETCDWDPPVPMPTTEGVMYIWNEDDLSWDVVD